MGTRSSPHMLLVFWFRCSGPVFSQTSWIRQSQERSREGMFLQTQAGTILLAVNKSAVRPSHDALTLKSVCASRWIFIRDSGDAFCLQAPSCLPFSLLVFTGSCALTDIIRSDALWHGGESYLTIYFFHSRALKNEHNIFCSRDQEDCDTFSVRGLCADERWKRGIMFSAMERVEELPNGPTKLF